MIFAKHTKEIMVCLKVKMTETVHTFLSHITYPYFTLVFILLSLLQRRIHARFTKTVSLCITYLCRSITGKLELQYFQSFKSIANNFAFRNVNHIKFRIKKKKNL